MAIAENKQMKLAVYQAPLSQISASQIVLRIQQRVKQCQTEGVRVLCCPEAVLGGLADDASEPNSCALNVESGQLKAALEPLASETVTTIIGFTEISASGNLYNSAAVFSHGNITGIYRKRHPAIRSSLYQPGSQSPLFSHGNLRFGIMICNDANFPDLAHDMASRGAQLIFIPSNNALTPENADILASTRAIDISLAKQNNIPIIRADVAGEIENRISYGTSAIVNAAGKVLKSGNLLSEDFLVASLELS